MLERLVGLCGTWAGYRWKRLHFVTGWMSLAAPQHVKWIALVSY